MPGNSSTPSTRKQASSATSSSKRQKKKQSIAEPSTSQDSPFSAEGYAEGVKVYGDDRCLGLKNQLSKNALEPLVAEVDASGVLRDSAFFAALRAPRRSPW